MSLHFAERCNSSVTFAGHCTPHNLYVYVITWSTIIGVTPSYGIGLATLEPPSFVPSTGWPGETGESNVSKTGELSCANGCTPYVHARRKS